jgi:regulatory protein
MPKPQRSLQARALQWLALREHSRAELRRKLLPLALAQLAEPGADGEPAPSGAEPLVDGVLQWLQAQGFLSDERFVESRVHTRSARFGNLRIRQELRQHGLELDASRSAALQSSELQRACAVRAKKFSAPPADAQARARQARFLAGRGFSPEVIQRALRWAARAAPDERESDGPCG